MSTIPILQIIIYLAMQFVPASAHQFTITCGADPAILFTRNADGTWQGTGEGGRDGGVWSAHGFVVTAVRQGQKIDTDLTKDIEVKTGEDQKKQITIHGIPVTIVSTATTVTFSQGDGGILKQPIVITWSAKPEQ